METRKLTEMGERVASLEASQSVVQGEILRRLDSLSIDFKELRDDIKQSSLNEFALATRVAVTEESLSSMKTKINRILGGIGTLLITLLGAGVTILGRKYLP